MNTIFARTWLLENDQETLADSANTRSPSATLPQPQPRGLRAAANAAAARPAVPS